ncbi:MULTISPECIES: hypothetical protein [Kitasatospora]|uniref:Uncharacterized protein n=1 Tax=Kitasatospora kifunensis TaxID=58351 RepID=A0A7W7R354_KITKI|nr:hypothetical protein [Kitasatospora kifunensis]MBB4924588.1 hypothetical protein [Kitasatospora kifunensis]
MVQDTPTAPAAEGGLLVAARKIAAARARTEQPSDVSSGRSDGND